MPKNVGSPRTATANNNAASEQAKPNEKESSFIELDEKMKMEEEHANPNEMALPSNSIRDGDESMRILILNLYVHDAEKKKKVS